MEGDETKMMEVCHVKYSEEDALSCWLALNSRGNFEQDRHSLSLTKNLEVITIICLLFLISYLMPISWVFSALRHVTVLLWHLHFSTNSDEKTQK